MSSNPSLGVVVIGRNEGERLRVCLKSLMAQHFAQSVVYVDSGSTDDSVQFARSLGCIVVNLDMGKPFTAARARNEGWMRALQLTPNLEYIMFVDGDCEVAGEWQGASTEFLQTHSDVAVVCGRRRERFPEASVYNMLCDIEWNTPVGSTLSCGGDATMRVAALKAVGGYRADLIAGEEPELCVRLRALGWKIWRLDLQMTLHDAAINKFSQWWNRNRRAGYAFAEGAYIHGATREAHGVRQTCRAMIWGAGLPILILVLGIYDHIWFLSLLIYPMQLSRVALTGKQRGWIAWCHSFFLLLGKFAEMQGILRFIANKLQRKAGRLIEYK